MLTGYFGRIDNNNRTRVTKVHAIYLDDGTTLCGTPVDKQHHFHFCAHTIIKKYIDCTKCKSKIARLENVNIR